MSRIPLSTDHELNRQILDFCKHIAGSAQIIAISQLDNQSASVSSVKGTLELVLIIRNYQARLMSYLKVADGRNVIVFAVDQWIFERDVERGFLGEALAGTLIFPYIALTGRDYLHTQEIMLKKRLILELLENLVLSYPQFSYRIHIRPQYFMYESMLNRVRVFPPLAYGRSKLMRENAYRKVTSAVLHGYTEALEQLEIEEKVILFKGYATIPEKIVVESNRPRVRFTNISKNAPRTLFTSLFRVFPQLLNYFSQNEALLGLRKFTKKSEVDETRHFLDPQKYLFVPTANGLVSLAERIDIDAFARKVLLRGKNAKIEFETVGGVLNDVYLIKAYPEGKEKKVLVKRFRDWSSFKWFPLTMWSLGARTFAVLGRSRLERECAIGEFLRCEGFNVPRVLSVSPNERLVIMEYVEGESLSNAIKRIAISRNEENLGEDLTKVMRVGEILARVHSLNVALGDTKPENAIVDPENKIYLLDFEQASHDGDKAWDIAEFLYYSGHYLPLRSNSKAGSIAEAFINGYLRAGGDVNTIRKAGGAKYTRVFSVFTLPFVIVAMSKACRKAEALR